MSQQKSSPGYVYFEYGRVLRLSQMTRYKVQLPFDMNHRQFLGVLYKSNMRVNMIYCNEQECQEFLSTVVEFLEENEKHKKENGGRILPRSTAEIRLLLCTLDRTCLHLLARLNGLNVSKVELGYGTKIVSFQDQDDLVDCFTKLHLTTVYQSEVDVCLPGHILESYFADRNVKSRQNSIQNTGAGALVEVQSIDRMSSSQTSSTSADDKYELEGWQKLAKDYWFFTIQNRQQKQYERHCRRYGFQSILLRFSKLRSVANAVPTLENPDERVLSQRSPPFQIGVDDLSSGHICTLVAWTLRVPMLLEFGVLFCFSDGQAEKYREASKGVIEYLKNNREPSSTPLKLSLEVRGDSDRYHLDLSNEYLDIFNEKKLQNLVVDFDRLSDDHLLHKALMVISKSICLRHVYVVGHVERSFSQMNDFLNELICITSTLIQPVKVLLSPRGGRYNDEMQHFNRLHSKVQRIARIQKVMEKNMDLHIIDVLVGAVVLRNSRKSLVNMLSINLLRKLREFIVDIRGIQ